MKFDVVVGNPPFQDGAYQLYANFYRMAINVGDEVSLIFPTSWQLPKNKNGLSLLNNEDIKHDKQIISIDNVEDAFPGINGAKYTNIIHWKRGSNNGLDGKQLIYNNGKDSKIVELYIDDYLFGKPKELIDISNKVESSSGFESIFRHIYLQNKFDLKNVYKWNQNLKSKVKSDGHYVQAHSWKKGAVEKNQTFCIDEISSAIETGINPEFAELTGTERYVYVDSHFVLNTPKYVMQDFLCRTKLTNYARHHIVSYGEGRNDKSTF